ncbi:response regulator transcription factor [bacterium]|nr:response regulator transcription factor [bacterium]
MTKVLIVDDHAIVREGLKQILAEIPGMVVAGEATTGEEALETIESQYYDVVVLDISLPDMSGLEILKQIKARHPQLVVLMLTIHPEEQYAVRVLQAGASGYLTKDTAPDELAAAVKKVAEGGRYVSPTLAEKLAFDLGPKAKAAPHESLSDREFEVLVMMASGKNVTKISEELHLSKKTISTYRRRILDKMGMETNAELIRYAVENELVE